MGDVRTLKSVFNDTWDWSTGGEEWSTWWGGTPSLWYGALLPRIHPFLPAPTVLEIAPGFGRWTQYLKDLAGKLILVDLAEKCIEHCQARFADANNIDYHVNDGRSLAMIPDASVDFVFTWDSLVHADMDIIDDYVVELARILTPNGVAFVHHSNVHMHSRSHAVAMRTPGKLLPKLINRGVLLDVYAWRAPTVSADRVGDACARSGLNVRSQELFTWEHGPYLTEAISLITPTGSTWARPTRRTRNRTFREEARRMAELYSLEPQPSDSPNG
jgi:ubiquinone/menaquinone biosynthesis C-methylase UbiE